MFFILNKTKGNKKCHSPIIADNLKEKKGHHILNVYFACLIRSCKHITCETGAVRTELCNDAYCMRQKKNMQFSSKRIFSHNW